MKTIISALLLMSFIQLSAINRPAPQLPAKGENYVQYDMVFKVATGISGAIRYVFEIDTVSSFASPFKVRDSVAALTLGQNMLKYGFGKRYYWRVQAVSASERSEWSDTWFFSVQSKVKLYMPASGSKASTIAPYFQIETFGAQPSYYLEADTVADFSSPYKKLRYPTASNPAQQIIQMPYGKTIYWRAWAYNGWGDTSDYSDVWTLVLPAAPTLGLPANNSTSVDTAVNYNVGSISGSSLTTVWLSEDSTFSDYSTYSGISGKFRGLKFGTTYYWKAKNSAGIGNESQWSPVSRFNTRYQISKPVVTAPSPGVTIQADSVTISWLAVTPQPVSGYFVEADTFSDFSTAYRQFSTINAAVLRGLSSGKYYFRLRGINDYGNGPWSSIQWFELSKPRTGIADIHSGHFSARLLNGILSIQSNCNCLYKYTLINMSGQTLVSGSAADSLHISTESVNSGIHVLILETNSGHRQYLKLFPQ